MQDAVREYGVQGAAIAVAAVALWFFWRLARAVAKWGFFVMYFIAGCLLALLFQPVPNVPVTLAAGLAFAWTVMAIRSKLWKLIGAAAVILAMPFFGPIAEKAGDWAKGYDKPAETPKD